MRKSHLLPFALLLCLTRTSHGEDVLPGQFPTITLVPSGLWTVCGGVPAGTLLLCDGEAGTPRYLLMIGRSWSGFTSAYRYKVTATLESGDLVVREGLVNIYLGGTTTPVAMDFGGPIASWQVTVAELINWGPPSTTSVGGPPQ